MGKWKSEDRTTLLRSRRWCFRRMRATFPGFLLSISPSAAVVKVQLESTVFSDFLIQKYPAQSLSKLS